MLYNDAYTTIQIMIDDVDIVATSDGVAPKFIGSFGWIMESSKERNTVYAKGPAGVYKYLSNRAEAYGLLSLVLFIFHVHEYMTTTIQSNFKTFLIKRA